MSQEFTSHSPPLSTLTPENIRAAVAQRYGEVATEPTGEFNFPVGRPFAEAIGYPVAMLDSLPAEAVGSFAGVTHFHHCTRLQPGMVVLDLGCGAGMDAIIAARAVAPTGRVIGVDYSGEMIARTRENATRAGVDNLEVLQSPVETLALPDASVDVAQANGVFNLSPEKQRAVTEVYRVLKPGGRIVAAEIGLQQAYADNDRATLQDWFR